MEKGTGKTTPGAGISLTPLSASAKDALKQAILEEYGALNLYQGVIAQSGNISPFSQKAGAEQQHIDALTRQTTKYGFSVPVNPGLTTDPAFNTFSGACQAGAAAEIEDAALYNELKRVVTHTDILKVFNNFQNASLSNHLLASQACQ